ncbi:xylan 1,4-beta-xylosidase [Nakamurella sp. YIM 132087]|uniref:Xylan 1,4-beta-xylosidase n=1 Tax=Nakamurella alba TaxID=2665158 RepID=A0A7K1FH78_9ACTN|nr:xylan 1,4-beta-xylosidase [Nakamurella alba]MTD12643.1 xylan 1,4-beta-xylosidase [Nakamurella alba]
MSTAQPDARTDWDNRISIRSGTGNDSGAALPDLPPPTGLVATGGIGQVTLSWDPVDGAVGYLLHRGPSADGPFEVVDHHGRDVLSVPHPPYVDTTGPVGERVFYAVSAIPEVTITNARHSAPVPATAAVATGAAPEVTATIGDGPGVPLDRPWIPMIGSERLSQLLCTDTTGGREIGTELLEALRRMHDEIGVRTVRAHAVFHDDTGVYREVDGEPVHDFSTVDRMYDLLIGIGLRPVVEIGFMPTDLASDPEKKVFAYGAVISPPKDHGRWADLVSALVRHLQDRYGADEVAVWDFEVWNEANLEVFWSGTQQEWLHLYDVTAAAVKQVDPRIQVGGPSSAAAGWVDHLLAHCARSGSPVDFVSTHTYGSPPLDVRASLMRHGFPDARVLWTEWGVTPTHFNPVNDSVFSAVFLLRGMRSAAGRIDALSYWVASDHFEELGRPPRLLHGGFGLLSVGNLPKPRFHAMTLLSRLGPTALPLELSGDGAGSLVEGWATRRADGGLTVLLWNLTLDQDKADGDPALDRQVALRAPGDAGTVRITRLAIGEGDLAAAAADLSIGDWPDEAGWTALGDAAAMPQQDVAVTDGVVRFALPMPSAVLLEFP